MVKPVLLSFGGIVSATVNPSLSKGDVNTQVQELSDAEPGSEVETDFYTPFDGTKGRAGGVYLDMQERADAEELRAKQEGRKPDLKNPPAVAGTPLVTENHLIDNSFSNPSSQAVAPVEKVDPVSTLTTIVPGGEPEAEEETTVYNENETETPTPGSDTQTTTTVTV